MIGFFLRGVQQMRARGRITRDRGLADIQRLRADFAHMVDPHQACSMPALRVIQHHLWGVLARVKALGTRRAQYGG